MSLDEVRAVRGLDESVIEQTSAEFLGHWHRLVSTTNWEKGRIICQWRKRLLAAAAPPALCSDEAWSRRVGNVSPQHVGRLRRTFERFGDVYPQFPGLYWSHFLAALDWDDAEMWLEGALQNGWSVAEMRRQRWHALGAVGEPAASEDELSAAEPDEDAPPDEALVQTLEPRTQPVRPAASEPDWQDGSGSDTVQGPTQEQADSAPSGAGAGETASTVRPFEDVPPLPDDLQEALDALKVAILKHKLAGWRATSAQAVLAALAALVALVEAPAG